MRAECTVHATLLCGLRDSVPGIAPHLYPSPRKLFAKGPQEPAFGVVGAVPRAEGTPAVWFTHTQCRDVRASRPLDLAPRDPSALPLFLGGLSK